MKLLIVSLLSLTFGAAIQYTGFTAVAENGQECSTCEPTEELVLAEEIKACLAEVPESCQYTLQVSDVNGETEVCSVGFGVSYAAAMGDFESATITALTGWATITIEPPVPHVCGLAYQTSQTEFCAFDSTEGIKGYFDDGSMDLVLDFVGTPTKFMNFYVFQGGDDCGSKFSSAYLQDAGSTLLLRGTKLAKSSASKTSGWVLYPTSPKSVSLSQ